MDRQAAIDNALIFLLNEKMRDNKHAPAAAQAKQKLADILDAKYNEPPVPVVPVAGTLPVFDVKAPVGQIVAGQGAPDQTEIINDVPDGTEP